jgi:hypothetical protein
MSAGIHQFAIKTIDSQKIGRYIYERINDKRGHILAPHGSTHQFNDYHVSSRV